VVNSPDGQPVSRLKRKRLFVFLYWVVANAVMVPTFSWIHYLLGRKLPVGETLAGYLTRETITGVFVGVVLGTVFSMALKDGVTSPARGGAGTSVSAN
jgi:hypothetical protein